MIIELEQLNIIATFFSGLVALVIFTQWNKQKGSEVVANEAKSVIIDLFELYKIFLELIHFNIDSSEELISKIKSFKSVSYSVGAKLTFISKTIHDKDQKIEKNIKKLTELNIKIDKLLEPYLNEIDDERLQKFERYMYSLVDSQNEDLIQFKKYMNLVLEDCKNIAMYKLKIQ